MNAEPNRDRRGGAVRPLLWSVLALAILVAIVAGGLSLRRSGKAAGSAAVAPDGEPGSSGGAGPALAGERIPVFSLIDTAGATVTDESLRGRVVVANFIFTRCGSVCPALTRQMAEIRRELAARGAGDVLSVSFTVDPAHDTPEILAEYASAFDADPTAWHFLTGDPAAVLHVVRDGFHLMMTEPGEGPPMHSNRFLVVDAAGVIRSTHLATDEGASEAIIRDTLAARGSS
jgi:protein SCO1/2